MPARVPQAGHSKGSPSSAFISSAPLCPKKIRMSKVSPNLSLHHRKAAAKVPADREALERQIAATDAEIDGLVYELYGLTSEEIKIVEDK